MVVPCCPRNRGANPDGVLSRPRDLAPTSSEEKLNENTIEVFADIGETEIPIAACYACGNTVPHLPAQPD